MGWSTIFIIDPAFSVPVILGVLAALVLSRERGLGHRLNHAGLALGVAWLALTLVIKAHVDRVAGDSLPAGVTPATSPHRRRSTRCSGEWSR